MKESRVGYFAPELLVVFGRGGSCYFMDGELKLRPASTFMVFDDVTRDTIPQIDLSNPPTGNLENEVVGGGNSNILAAVHYLNRLYKRDKYVKEIIFAAGRPPYIQKLSETMTEGEIMIPKFQRLGNYYGLPDVPVGNFRTNRNSWDDTRESLNYALRKGYKNVAIIQIGLQNPRINEFLKKAKSDNITLSGINVEVFDSWDILSGVSSHYKRIFESVEESMAYKKTAAMEEKGIQDLRSGKYILNK